MADRKITAHTAITAADVATNDVIEIVDISDTTDAASGTNKKMTASEGRKLFSRYGILCKGSTLDRYHGGAPHSAFAATTAVLTINSLRVSPIWIPEKVTVDRMMVNVTVGSSGKVRIGLYNDDGNGYPASLVIDGGEISITGTGAKVVTLGASVDLEPGLYWLCHFGNTANTFTGTASSAYLPVFGGRSLDAIHSANGYASALTYTTLPSSYPAGGTVLLSTLPFVGLRFT